jgi:predicted Rossmann-fold nucleotide-binding protein
MKTIGVYLGANFGKNAPFKEVFIRLGNEIAGKALTLIYGGSTHGMMSFYQQRLKN